MPWKSVQFELLTAAVVGIVLLGLAERLLSWVGNGRPAQGGPRSWGQWALLLVRAAARAAGSRALWGALALDVALQRRLYRLDRVRWLVHMGLTWSCVELFFVGSLGLFFADLGSLPLTKDTAWFAALNEVAGVVLLLSVSAALSRALLLGEERAGASARYVRVLLFLGLVGLTGFFVEAARYLEEATPASTAAYGFLGYGLSRALAPADLAWHSFHLWLWWGHALVAFALIASLPFGRLLHIVTSPASILANAPPKAGAPAGAFSLTSARGPTP